MKIRINQDIASAAMEQLARVNPRYTQGGLHLSAHRSHLHWQLQAEDTMTSVTTPVTSREDAISGATTLPFARLHAVIQHMPPKAPLTLSMHSPLLRIAAEGVVASVSALDEEERPRQLSLREQGDILLFTLPATDFTTITRMVCFAAASDEQSRPFFQCVCIEPSENGLEFVAADVHRMSHALLACSHNMDMRVLIPAKALAAFSDSIRPESTVCCYRKATGDGVLLVADNIGHFISIPVAGFYPVYGDIYPQSASSYEVLASALLEAVERCALYLAQPLEGVYLHADGHALVVSTYKDRTTQDEEGISTLITLANFTGEPYTARFPIRFLLQCLHSLQTVNSNHIVTLEFNKGIPMRHKPLVITPKFDLNIRFSIMPLTT